MLGDFRPCWRRLGGIDVKSAKLDTTMWYVYSGDVVGACVSRVGAFLLNNSRGEQRKMTKESCKNINKFIVIYHRRLVYEISASFRVKYRAFNAFVFGMRWAAHTLREHIIHSTHHTVSAGRTLAETVTGMYRITRVPRLAIIPIWLCKKLTSS